MVSVTANVFCDGQTALGGTYSVLPRLPVRNQVTPAQCRKRTHFSNSPVLFAVYNFGGAMPRSAATSAGASANQPFPAKMRRPAVASEGLPWATYDDAKPIYKVVANIGLHRQFPSVAGRTSELAHTPSSGKKTVPDITEHAPLVTSNIKEHASLVTSDITKHALLVTSDITKHSLLVTSDITGHAPLITSLHIQSQIELPFAGLIQLSRPALRPSQPPVQ